MNIIIGMDANTPVTQSGSMLQALKLSSAHYELVHVLERLSAYSLPTIDGSNLDLINRYLEMQDEEAKKLVRSGQSDLKALGLDCSTKVLVGASANRIISHAKDTQTDLLVLGSSGKGRIEALLAGSVSRKALISADCSVLITKNKIEPQNRPLTLVFATDHSEYAQRCIDQFLSWSPRGIGKAIVATVYPDQLLQAMSSIMQNFKSDVAGWVKKELEASNQKVVQKFAKLDISCTSRVESGPVSETLAKIMQEEKADLLVLGAQGHGFVERLTLGSIAMEQSLRRPYSTLVVRA